MRLNHKQLEHVKNLYDVDRIWSFSRVNTVHNCMWEYWAKYIKHMKLDTGNVYTTFGTFSHNLIQDMLMGKMTYSQMTVKWDEIVREWDSDPNSYQFDNDKIKVGYISNLSHYFGHTQVPAGHNFEVEKPVLATIGKRENGKPKYVFVGYVDTQYIDEDGNTVLVDYKTSSKSSFSKAKLPEKSKQLMLYAMAKHQHNGTPYNKIRCLFDMMKYVTVHYKQENGAWKESVQERAKWVSKMSKKLATKLKKAGVDSDKAQEMIQVASLSNSMDNMPKEIKDQFLCENYVIELEVTEEKCKQLASDLEKECDEILQFEEMSDKDQETYLETNCPYDPDNYYEKKLCAYHTSPQFKEKEKALDDLLEPQLANTDTDHLMDQLFSEEESPFAGVFD